MDRPESSAEIKGEEVELVGVEALTNLEGRMLVILGWAFLTAMGFSGTLSADSDNEA